MWKTNTSYGDGKKYLQGIVWTWRSMYMLSVLQVNFGALNWIIYYDPVIIFFILWLQLSSGVIKKDHKVDSLDL